MFSFLEAHSPSFCHCYCFGILHITTRCIFNRWIAQWTISFLLERHAYRSSTMAGRSPSLCQLALTVLCPASMMRARNIKVTGVRKPYQRWIQSAVRVGYLGLSAMTIFGRRCKASAGVHRNSRLRLNGMQIVVQLIGQGTPHNVSIQPCEPSSTFGAMEICIAESH